VAPINLRERTIALIDEQAARAREGKKSRIFAKLNSLVDRRTIEALYRASQAGVPIDLVIRGICCLRPGLPGISESIRVRSIVDRFLEHSRILVFGEGAKQQVFLSSADWMPRNFDRRVEVMYPVEAEDLRWRIVEEIIPAYLQDNSRARVLLADGSYAKAERRSDDADFRSQTELLKTAATRIILPPIEVPKVPVSPAPLLEAVLPNARRSGRGTKTRKALAPRARRRGVVPARAEGAVRVGVAAGGTRESCGRTTLRVRRRAGCIRRTA
jgi:polyphosphate kinase